MFNDLFLLLSGMQGRLPAGTKVSVSVGEVFLRVDISTFIRNERFALHGTIAANECFDRKIDILVRAFNRDYGKALSGAANEN